MAFVHLLFCKGSVADICNSLGQERYMDFERDISRAKAVREAVSKAIEGYEGHTHEARGMFVSLLYTLDAFIDGSITDDHRELHSVGQGMNFDYFGTCRPTWAKGAHIFVTPNVADEIQESLEGVELTNKLIVVSPEYKDVVERALGAHTHERPSKQPRVISEQLIEPVNAYSEWCKAYYFEQRVLKVCTATLKTFHTHTTGSLPRRAEGQGEKSYGKAAYKKAHPRQIDITMDKAVLVDCQQHNDADQQLAHADEVNQTFSCAASTLDSLPDHVHYPQHQQIDSLLDELIVADSVPANIKNAKQFGEYVCERLHTFPLRVCEAILLKLEPHTTHYVTQTQSNPKSSIKDAIKGSLKLIFGWIKCCFKPQHLLKFLSPHSARSSSGLQRACKESLDLLLQLEGGFLGELNSRLKQASKKLRSDIAAKPGLSEDGPHAMATVMCECVVEATSDTLREMNLEVFACQSWNAQETQHKAKVKDEAKARPAARVRLPQTDMSLGPAWFVEEARRHITPTDENPHLGLRWEGYRA